MTDQPPESPRRRRRQPPPAPQAQGSPAKGAVLVIVALLVGFALLRDEGSSTAQIDVGSSGNPTVTDDGGSTTTSSSTTTAPPRAPEEVKVLVANGSGVTGAAGAVSSTLEALGYVAATPTNAQRVPATVVYFTDGYKAEALQLATAIGAPPTSVTPLPTPAPVTDMQLSNILVVVGPELASKG